VRTGELGSHASDNPVAGREPTPGKERYSILGYRRGASTLTSIPQKREATTLKRAERRQEEEEEKKKKKKETTPTTKSAGNANELERNLIVLGHMT
jgi:hypothetical protein